MSFIDTVKGRLTQRQVYIGEGEEDIIDDLGLADIMQDHDVVEDVEICLVVDIPWESYKQSWKQWRRALIIKVLRKNFSFKVLEPRILRLWQLQEGCQLIDIDKGYLVAHFYSKQDYLKVLNRGPWIVMDHYLTILKWRPNFKPGDKDVRSTLVWLCFPQLPLEIFVETSLSQVENAVGKAIKVDPITAEMIKGRYARVCVELNLYGILPPNVLVYGRKHVVEYEGLHHICFRCGGYGHKKEQWLGVVKNKETEASSKKIATTPMQVGSTAAQPFRPWMLQAHVCKKYQMLQSRITNRSFSNVNHRRDKMEQRNGNKERKQANPSLNESGSFMFGSHARHQGMQEVSASRRGTLGTATLQTFDGKLKYQALVDIDKEDSVDKIELLKQKIKDISEGKKGGLHEKAQIKLERGLNSKNGPKVNKGKTPIITNKDMRRNGVGATVKT